MAKVAIKQYLKATLVYSSPVCAWR